MSDILRDILKSCKGKTKKMKGEINLELSGGSETGDVKEKLMEAAGGESKVAKENIHSDDEESMITDNLKYITKFLSLLNKRDVNDLSKTTQDNIRKMRAELELWLKTNSDDDSDNRKEFSSDSRSCKNRDDKRVDRGGGGAIPKKRKNIVTFDEHSSSAKESSEETSEDAWCNRDRKSGGRSRTREDGWVRLSDVMSQLNRGKIPDFEKFDEVSGQDLYKYLKKFEVYCKENLNGGRDGWLMELEKNLSGKTLRAFKVVKGFEDDYYDVKASLLEWYKDNAENRKLRNVRKFEEMRYEEREELYLYCCRLEKAYKLAYPKKDYLDSYVLTQKFNSSIPKRARKLLSTYKMINRITSKKMSWKEVKRCAKLYDCETEEREEEKVKEYEDSEEEIVINVGQSWLKKESGAEKRQLSGNNVFHSDSYEHSPRNLVESQRNSRSGNPRYNGEQYGGNGRSFRTYNHGGERNYNYHNDRGQWNHREPNGQRKAGYYSGENRSRYSQNGMSFVPNSLKEKAVVCFNCKKLGHIASRCQSNMLCYRCGGVGHFARVCPSTNVSRDSNNRSMSVGDMERQRHTNYRDSAHDRDNNNINRNSRSSENVSRRVVAGDDNTSENVHLSGGIDYNRIPVDVEVHNSLN